MKEAANILFGLLIVIAGVLAGWSIYHFATTNSLTNAFTGSEAKYAPLKQSILNQ